VKVKTPLGEYPFEFRRIERNQEGVAVVGLVAGLESGFTLSPTELAKVGLALALPLAAAAFLGAAARRR
jgi:hypothetical protein